MNTAKLTPTDLMQVHGETLEEARYERLFKNIQARAAVLFTTAGYTHIRTMDTENVQVFQVRSPEGKRYQVKISQTPAPAGSFYGSKCSCPCFEDVKSCKHLLACKAIVDAEKADEKMFEAQATAHDAETADAAWYSDRLTFRPHELSSHFAEAA